MLCALVIPYCLVIPFGGDLIGEIGDQLEPLEKINWPEICLFGDSLKFVQIAATAMRVEQLADLELAYPTFTAVVGLAARRISRTLGLVPLASTEGGGSVQRPWPRLMPECFTHSSVIKRM